MSDATSFQWQELPPEDAIAALPIDQDAPWHAFMRSNGEYDRMEIATALQDAVNELPETTVTFRPDDIVGFPRSAIPDRLVELTGAWVVPPVYPVSIGRGKRFVNPGSSDRYLYADTVTRCECGALLVREERVLGETVTQGEHEHTDACRKDWRLRARAELCRQRREIIVDALHLGHPVKLITDRLGLSRNAFRELADDLTLDINQHKSEGKQRLARTWVRLLLTHSAEEIGAAYGVSGQTIRRIVSDVTDLTPSTFYEYRRRL